MLIKNSFAAIIITVLAFGNILAQNLTSKSLEISPELRKNALELLRQTIKEVPNLKAEENRQYFTIETAQLLWKYDEKEARVMLSQMMEELKQSSVKISEKYKKAAEELRKKRKNANTNYGYYNAVNRPANVYSSNRVYNAGNAVESYEPEISIYEVGMERELRRIEFLQRRLIDTLILTEPEMAYKFFRQFPKFPYSPEDYAYYSSYEPRIVESLLEKNKIETALAIANEMLNKEFSSTYMDILRRIHRKNSIKGRELAEQTWQKIISETNYKVSTHLLNLFFDRVLASAEGNTQNAMLSEKSLKDLAHLLGKWALTKYEINNAWVLEDIAQKINKYSPTQALKIRQTLKRNPAKLVNENAANTATREYWGWQNEYSSPQIYASNSAANAVNAAANAANAAARAVNMAANQAVNSPARPAKPKTKSTATPQEKLSSITGSFIQDSFDPFFYSRDEVIEKLRVGKFTAEERKKVIKLAKEFVLLGNSYSYTRPDGFLRTIAELARFAINSADKEVADELMKEAEIYVRPEAKNYADYAGKLLLAGGYSNHNPDKSFAIMESMVTINEVIESAVKFGVFFDVETDLFLGDEVSALFFFGERRGISNLSKEIEFRMFIHNLAKTDFQRTKALADKFEKTEVKIAAKMLILDSLLGESN